MSTTPQPPPAGVPTPKKTSPWIFVLIGCASIIVISGVIMVALGIFAVNKAKEAGLDPDLMREQPALAMAKIIAAADPDIDVVDVDEGAGRITFRQKSTGKTITMNADDVKKGRISFESDDGETMSFEASEEGEEGSLRVRSSEGDVEFGASVDVDLPNWIASYPGSRPEGVMNATTPEGRTSSFSFKTSDSAEKVIEFYKQSFESDGMRVNSMVHGGAEAGGTVQASNDDDTRYVMVIVGPDDDGSNTVGVTFQEK